MMMELLRYIPKDYLSLIMGYLSHIPLPPPFNVFLLKWFTNRYRINIQEASQELSSYPSIGDFFTRDLKDGVRPICGDVVFPADGTCRGFGVLSDGMIEQIKGREYSLSSLLQEEDETKRFSDGFYFNIYLSPQDYHHIHSPITGKVRKMTHIPGKLWPVNDWSIANIDSLFAVNERVITYLTSELGEIAVVMVGATNVGKISLSFDSLITNQTPWSKKELATKDFSTENISLIVGQRLGTFHLGSSVVLLFSQSFIRNVSNHGIQKGEKTQFGQKIA